MDEVLLWNRGHCYSLFKWPFLFIIWFPFTVQKNLLTINFFFSFLVLIYCIQLQCIWTFKRLNYYTINFILCKLICHLKVYLFQFVLLTTTLLYNRKLLYCFNNFIQSYWQLKYFISIVFILIKTSLKYDIDKLIN